MIRLLIADDDPEVCAGMRDCIAWERCGVEVVATVNDGLSAYEYIIRNRPDIVFIDVRMPLLSGLEVVEKVRARSYGTIFIILSGYSNFEYAKQALQNQVEDYLLKPAQPQEILEAVQKSIRKLEVYKSLVRDCTDSLIHQFYTQYFIATHAGAQTLPVYPAAAERELLALLGAGTRQEVLDALERFFAAVERDNPDPMAAMTCCTMLYMELYRFAAERRLNYQPTHLLDVTEEGPDAGERLRSLMRQVLGEVYDALHPQRPYSSAISDVLAYIQQHYREEIDLTGAAARVYLSPGYLSSQFKQAMGVSFVDYINRVRIEHAKKLLEDPAATNYQTAQAVGFSNEKYFSQVFKKVTGMTPSQYREMADNR